MMQEQIAARCYPRSCGSKELQSPPFTTNIYNLR